MRLVSDEDYHSMLESAVVNSFVDTNEALHQSEIDDTMSGTTAITILMRGRDIFVANVGDSRAFIAEVDPENGNELIAEDLSHDQTPYRRDECDRVRRAGATVMTLDQLEGLKNPKVDCFAEDHQILTERGFLSLEEFEAAEASGTLPRILAFHPEDKTLVPEACQRLIVHPAQPQTMIEVSDGRWGPEAEAEAYGVRRPGTSIVMTKNHDVYTEMALCSSTPEQDAAWTGAFRKVKAVDLLPSANPSDPSRPVEVFRLLCRAEGGIGIAEDGPLPAALQDLLARLEIGTPDQMEAVLALVGFWLGGGEMRTAGPAFRAVAAADRSFLRACFDVLGWAEGAEFVAGETAHGAVVALTEPHVCAFFLRECGVKAAAADTPVLPRTPELLASAVSEARAAPSSPPAAEDAPSTPRATPSPHREQDARRPREPVLEEIETSVVSPRWMDG